MKIPSSVRLLYESLLPEQQRLGGRVDQVLGPQGKTHRWYYESRIKQLESFALKIESGRFLPEKLEDFFACTIVVQTPQKLAVAEDLVRQFCDIQKRRQELDAFTHKSPELFSFDDLRLYVKLRTGNEKPIGLESMLFEIQIKTFLQHAWSIATHDLIYKSTGVSWPQARIAYQIKAMLEHAELAIFQANQLAGSALVAKQDRLTKSLLAVIELLQQHWTPEELPSDTSRLARTLSDLLDALNITTAQLNDILAQETTEGRGTNILSLSPFAVIVQSLLNQCPDKIKEHCAKEKVRFKIFIPEEIELPGAPEFTNLKNCVRVQAPHES